MAISAKVGCGCIPKIDLWSLGFQPSIITEYQQSHHDLQF